MADFASKKNMNESIFKKKNDIKVDESVKELDDKLQNLEDLMGKENVLNNLVLFISSHDMYQVLQNIIRDLDSEEIEVAGLVGDGTFTKKYIDDNLNLVLEYISVDDAILYVWKYMDGDTRREFVEFYDSVSGVDDFNTYTYIIDMDERGEFSAHIEDIDGNEVYTIKDTEELEYLINDGFMANKNDIVGLQSHLISIGVLDDGDSLTESKCASTNDKDKKSELNEGHGHLSCEISIPRDIINYCMSVLDIQDDEDICTVFKMFVKHSIGEDREFEQWVEHYEDDVKAAVGS